MVPACARTRRWCWNAAARSSCASTRAAAGLKPGDVIALRIAQGFLKLPVAGCEPKGLCVARGALQAGAETQFLNAKGAQLVVPQPNGKAAALPLPLIGLSQAVDAMKRAES